MSLVQTFARPSLGAEGEEFLAELTQAAYSVLLSHGFEGSFLNVQLDLWAALREVVEEQGGRP